MDTLTKAEFDAIDNKKPYDIVRYVKFLLDSGKKKKEIIYEVGIKKSQLTCYIKIIKLGKIDELKSGTSVRSIIVGKTGKRDVVKSGNDIIDINEKRTNATVKILNDIESIKPSKFPAKKKTKRWFQK